jgi:HSP20 family protein
MSEREPQAEKKLTASIEALRHELDRWLEFAVEQGERAIDAIRPRGGAGTWIPPADVLESTEEVLVVIDLPGVDPEAMEISLAGNMLTIRGEKPGAALAAEQTRHQCERPSGTFSRSIAMPAPVDPDAVSAESKQGVVTIRLAKSERAKARKIAVKTIAAEPPPQPPPPV